MLRVGTNQVMSFWPALLHANMKGNNPVKRRMASYHASRCQKTSVPRIILRSQFVLAMVNLVNVCRFAMGGLFITNVQSEHCTFCNHNIVCGERNPPIANVLLVACFIFATIIFKSRFAINFFQVTFNSSKNKNHKKQLSNEHPIFSCPHFDSYFINVFIV
jgi:hypothetical protein